MATRRSPDQAFRLGDWRIRPALDRIERDGEQETLEPQAMSILVYLAERPGEVISGEQLIAELWEGKVVSDNTLYQWIHLLRKALGDDPHKPVYIATIPKKGYRLVAPVDFQSDGQARVRKRWFFAASVALLVLILAGISLSRKTSEQPILPAAQEAYLMGQHQLANRTAHAMEQAVEHFESAIELDADFALAWVGLADALILLDWYDDTPPEDWEERARAAIHQALTLDENLGEAYTSLGMLLVDSDQDQGEAAFKKALELSPDHVLAHYEYGMLLKDQGRWDEALQRLERARELDPLSAIVNAGLAFLLEEMGRYPEALEQYRIVASLDPGFRQVNFDQGVLLWFGFGQIDEAFRYFNQEAALWDTTLENDPSYRLYMFSDMAFAALDVGAYEMAQAITEQILTEDPDHVGARFAMISLGVLLDSAGAGAAELERLDHGIRASNAEGPPDLVSKVTRLLRNLDLQAGLTQQALSRYEIHFPELLDEAEPSVTRQNYRAAIDLALVLQKSGDPELAAMLLQKSSLIVEDKPRLGFFGYGIDDVMILALQGKHQEAIRALEEAVSEGWRRNTRYFLEHEPNLFSLHGLPGFESVLAFLATDLDRQLQNIQDMSKTGRWDLPPP